MTAIQADIEARLAAVEPDVEVLLAEVVSGDLVRLFIDHPSGVNLDLCERVTKHLAEVREAYALEVSSPGTERPLSKPSHYERFLGRRARVRTTEPIEGPGPAGRQSTFTGEIVGATEAEITLAAAGGVISIPYSDVKRSHLLGD